MKPDAEDYLRGIMSGESRGIAAGAARAGLSLIESVYAGAMMMRNRLYDIGALRSVRLERPVISVGNLTAGGTGKTPMVRWLASHLRDQGRTAAILSRGYKSAGGQPGDEQRMLDQLLNAPGASPVVLKANPNRQEAARQATAENSRIDVFLLDDAFQHRRIQRELDIVLLAATDPFGYGHVLPRGMLREPLAGLGRAGAVVITHADCASEDQARAIEQRVRAFNPSCPIYRAMHAHAGLRYAATPAAAPPDMPMEELHSRRFFAFCGIGNPRLFSRQLEAYGPQYVGRQWFADHHRYTAKDLAALRAQAAQAGAEELVTTEKDWVKIAGLADAEADRLRILRIDVRMRFNETDSGRLIAQIRRVIGD
ncbi:MAG TPA: tetraacyldisaccharide 4'-kinase [Tepidisphaeraceae bacterium]|nr:tetraacyldisaccharide 4'-kinase [Tepidisphaeraceae bacterium]